jgi:predicted branched-subunit amino acid permease
MARHSDIRAGIRAALSVALPTLALGASFGLLAEPVMGSVAPVVMSILVFSGGAQFASLSVLQAGGAAGAAIGAGLLMNARWVPMSLAVTPSLEGGTARRALESQAIVDASFAIASRRDGSFDRGLLIGATIPQASSWIAGTLVGVLASGQVQDPDRFGLDAIFPAFYLAILVAELRERHESTRLVAIGLAAAITLATLPFAPPGLSIIAACTAALVGLRRA